MEVKVLLQKQMTDEELEIEFLDAVERVNAYTDPFPADVLLNLYAYYKKATNNYSRPSSKKAIINAFKCLVSSKRHFSKRSKTLVY